MVTTPEFWDCNCSGRYIHPKDRSWCPTCGAKRDDQPDSRPEEVLKSSLLWKPREEPPYETVESTVERLDGYVRLLREALKASLKDNLAHHLISEVIAEEKGYAQLPTEPASIKIARAALEATKEGA